MLEEFLDPAYSPLEDEGRTSPPGGSSRVCSSCQRGEEVLVKVYKDPDLEEKERPENLVLLDGPRELSLADGFSPEFEAYVCSTGEKLPCAQKVRAHFELSQLAVEPGVDGERAIYPNHPVLGFGTDLTRAKSCQRHPVLLFDPETNLDLGVRYLTRFFVTKVFQGRAVSLSGSDERVSALKKVLAMYNVGRKTSNLEYANMVWQFVPLFRPGL